jgi:hypothetical protein
MHGDVAFKSFLKNCSIHHTYSRALAVHGTNHLNISYNVGFHAMGHMFFIEDGAEVGNSCLGLVCRRLDQLPGLSGWRL